MSNRGRLPRRSLSSSRLPERVTAIASTTPWWKCNAIRNAGSAVRLTKRPASPVFMVAVTRVLKRDVRSGVRLGPKAMSAQCPDYPKAADQASLFNHLISAAEQRDHHCP